MTQLETLRGTLVRLEEQENQVNKQTDEKVSKLRDKHDADILKLRDKQIEVLTAIDEHMETLEYEITQISTNWKFKVVGYTNAKRVVVALGYDAYTIEEK